MERYLKYNIIRDLEKKMVFLAGPRQCGKTTFALALLAERPTSPNSQRYFNWDDDFDRKHLLEQKFPPEKSMLVFDEIHKFKRWKNWVKGIYDKKKYLYSILVTGSARLDVYRPGGDSLLGRYHLWRLHPMGFDEVPPNLSPEECLHRLMTLGGFPEPFLGGDEREARRWRRERLQRVLRDDVRDLESVRDISTLELFVAALRTRVGGIVTLANIAQDLQVAPKTLKAWLQVLERMYVVFSIYPYTTGLPRSLLKPPKVFFYDNGDVDGEKGARFENLVATQLLKRYQFLEDRDGYEYRIHYLRDKEKREVDFLVLKDGKPHLLVEAKWNDSEISPTLAYYAKHLKPKHIVQVVGELSQSYQKNDIKVVSASQYFSTLDSDG
ncbi:MAG: AAA family ATPase [Pseudomonadota bacterium]